MYVLPPLNNKRLQLSVWNDWTLNLMNQPIKIPLPSCPEVLCYFSKWSNSNLKLECKTKSLSFIIPCVPIKQQLIRKPGACKGILIKPIWLPTHPLFIQHILVGFPLPLYHYLSKENGVACNFPFKSFYERAKIN